MTSGSNASLSRFPCRFNDFFSKKSVKIDKIDEFAAARALQVDPASAAVLASARNVIPSVLAKARSLANISRHNEAEEAIKTCAPRSCVGRSVSKHPAYSAGATGIVTKPNIYPGLSDNPYISALKAEIKEPHTYHELED